MKIYIDADACPVKDETVRVAERHGVQVYIVSNGGLRPNPHSLVEMVTVAAGADEADKWIADQADVGDVVITGDIPLAARAIENGAAVLKHNGEELDGRNIGQILASRDLMADIRAADPFHQGGGKSFTKADRSAFLNALERVLQRLKR